MLINFKRQITKIIKERITIKPLKSTISSKGSKKASNNYVKTIFSRNTHSIDLKKCHSFNKYLLSSTMCQAINVLEVGNIEVNKTVISALVQVYIA